MLSALARFLVRRHKLVLAASAIAFVVAGAFGGNVAKYLSTGGFEDPSAESTRAQSLLEDTFGTGDPNLVLLVTAKRGNVDDPAVAELGNRLTQELDAQPHVENAVSYWSLGNPPPLRSDDARQGVVLARITGTEDEVIERVDNLAPGFDRSDAVATVEVGGFSHVFNEISSQIEQDLTRAEVISFPVILVLLVLVFGSVVAASLPLSIGFLAIIGTFFALRLVSLFTEVSVFSLSLTTAMGLGLAIDYSLFVVSRFREELANGLESDDAVVRTVQTACRTVLFSAVTVAISLAALLIFPLAFLRSFAYAGIAVVVVAAIGATVVLPALLAVLGPKVDKLAVHRHKPKPVGEGFWHRVATFVMRRPVPIAAAVIALLLFLGMPFLHIAFGLPDDRVLPPGHPGRTVTDDLRRNFSSHESLALSAVATGVGDPQARTPEIDEYAVRLSRLPDASRVDALTGSYIGGARVAPPDGPVYQRFAAPDATFVSVVPKAEAQRNNGEGLAKDVRAERAPFPVQVTGPAAELIDAKKALFARMPWAAGAIALVTFTLLFLMFGSVVVPVKAIVLNLLSLTATFGAMVWIFQDGHLSELLNFSTTGDIVISTPILMFCVAFGLSMDYEVFLLSRIKEEYDRTGDNVASVAIGLERTGRIVTAAAALLAVVFIAFATSEVSFIKLFGIGLTMAVLMDATLIRAALVPAFMRLAGRANWWAPPFMHRFYDRWGFSDAPAAEPPAGSPDGGERSPHPAGVGSG